MRIGSLIRRTVSRSRLSEERGQVLVLVAGAMVVLVGMAGLVIDFGRLYFAQRQLQSTADSAALAAASVLPNVSAATAAAQDYSGANGDLNSTQKLPGVTTNVLTKCVSGLPCNPANTIDVSEQAQVSTVFLKIFGLDSVTVHANAVAAMGGGTPQPLNVMLVLDRTASMNQPCTEGGTKLGCAKSAVLNFLSQMNPTVDHVGLAVFPPPTSLSNTCSSSKSALSYDNPSAKTTDPNYPYTVVPLSTDYRTSPSGQLNQSSNLVKTVNCLQAPGGHGTSFATAIEKAQAELVAQGDPTAQNVIILLSDGDANYGPVYYDNPPKKPEVSPYRTQPCQQAVNSAASATASGTWVYAVAYDTDANNSDPDCYGWTTHDSPQTTSTFSSHEQPLISGITTMQGIASDPTKFYLDPQPGDLTVTFDQIEASFSTPVLIADHTTTVN
jgi:Flp pilus assembly protein TadG